MNLLDDIIALVKKTRVEDWEILGDQGCFIHKSTGLILKKSSTKTALRASNSYEYSIGRVKKNASCKGASDKSSTFYTGDKAEEMFDLVRNAYFEAKAYKKNEEAILKLINDLNLIYNTSFSF